MRYKRGKRLEGRDDEHDKASRKRRSERRPGSPSYNSPSDRNSEPPNNHAPRNMPYESGYIGVKEPKGDQTNKTEGKGKKVGKCKGEPDDKGGNRKAPGKPPHRLIVIPQSPKCKLISKFAS